MLNDNGTLNVVSCPYDKAAVGSGTGIVIGSLVDLVLPRMGFCVNPCTP